MPNNESAYSSWALVFDEFSAPVPLVRRGQRAPARAGLYVVSCDDCVPHIGTSGNLQNRLRSLASLGNHRGSAEVLCAAHCTGFPPVVRWRELPIGDARQMERRLKDVGEPPQPRDSYEKCVNGGALRRALVAAAGEDSWEAGYIEALFDVGEQLSRLFASRFATLWSAVGQPPGPWSEVSVS